MSITREQIEDLRKEFMEAPTLLPTRLALTLLDEIEKLLDEREAFHRAARNLLDAVRAIANHKKDKAEGV